MNENQIKELCSMVKSAFNIPTDIMFIWSNQFKRLDDYKWHLNFIERFYTHKSEENKIGHSEMATLLQEEITTELHRRSCPSQSFKWNPLSEKELLLSKIRTHRIRRRLNGEPFTDFETHLFFHKHNQTDEEIQYLTDYKKLFIPEKLPIRKDDVSDIVKSADYECEAGAKRFVEFLKQKEEGAKNE